MQGDLSVSFGTADRSLLSGVFFIGGALGWTRNTGVSLFGAVGPEMVYAASPDPYRISLGAQIRAGLAWARHRDGEKNAIPDVLLYLRVTPFGAGAAMQAKNMAGMTVTATSWLFGVRAGIGVTSVYLARWYVDSFPLTDIDGFAGDVVKVLTTLFLFPLTAVNHGEIAFEWASSPKPIYAAIFRVGAGF